MAAGHGVPEGFVVPPGMALAGAEGHIADALAALGEGPFAVRSSAVHEDGLARSFAGQLETALGVSSGDVSTVIARCRRSAEALHAVAYGDVGEVAVLVQRMVPARAAGVAFSADPRSGERGVVVIDAVRGLADRLVAGAACPEAWRCEGDGARCVHPTSPSALDASQALRVAALAREMEALHGAPQDIEWAFEGDTLWLLQSRPITALPAPPVPLDLTPPPGDWERDDHHGVLSPLGWDWFQPYPVAMGEGMRALGVPVRAVHTTRVGGHLYLQMEMPGGAAMPPRWVLWLASRLIPAMRKADREGAAMLDGETYLRDIDRWERETRPALRAEVDACFDPRPAALSDDALLAKLRDALALTARGLAVHAALGGPGILAMGKLQLFVEDHLGWGPATVLGLLAGSSSATTAEHRAIESLVRAHADEIDACGALPRRWGALHAKCPRFAAALAAWLDANRLRMLHYDPRHPMLGERPELVLSIAHAVVASRGAATVARSRAIEWDEARARLDPARFETFERLLAGARRGYALRDENGIDTVSRPAGLLRWFVLELGRRLAPALEAPEHAVYLYAPEHAPALRGEIPDLAARVARRRGEESWALRRRPPRRFGATPPPMTGLDVFPSGLRRGCGSSRG
ncbi:MAG: PEP/pyruvate-binding domain-containing protein [Polyangiales bacterium]